MVLGKRKRPHSLSHGRPLTNTHKTLPSHESTSQKPTSGQPSTSFSARDPLLSSRHTRRLIRTHHTLQKQLSAALAASDAPLAASLAAQIDAAGGLERYQLASRIGQRRERGGDASSVLVHWLKQRRARRPGARDGGGRKLTMLDVGALTTDTAASRSGMFDMSRIDLKSGERGILEQDFMARPLPVANEDRFDVVSLSLVVNYVPDARVRGDMLRRVCSFLRGSQGNEMDEEEWHGLEDENKDEEDGENEKVIPAEKAFPCLFIVLPAPCVLNSRYLTARRFEEMMVSLGYEVAERKTSAKLAYWLCIWRGESAMTGKSFKKTIVNDGKGRNNFAIVLDGT